MKHPRVETRPTHGGNLAWAAQLANCSPHGLLDFSASISPLGPPTSVLTAIQTALSGIQRYPIPEYSALRQALAEHHGVDPDWVLPGNGAAELLTWIGRDLAALAHAAVITPAFADYGRSLQAFGGTLHPCPLPLDGAIIGEVNWAEVVASQFPHLGQRDQRGLLLNTPHNPTGLLIPPDTIHQWLDQFAWVVVDEAFMDFLPPEQQSSVMAAVAEHPQLVVVRSLTKFYSLPGLRLGYAIAHPDHLRRWQQWRDPWPVNTLAEAAAIAALQDAPYQQAVWRWLPTARQELITGLAALPGLTPFPGVANYVLVRTDRVIGPTVQYRLLTEHHILVRDCLSFAELGDRYLRLAVRTASENQQLLAALAQVLG